MPELTDYTGDLTLVEVGAGIQGGYGAPSAAGMLLSKLNEGLRDANVLVFGDSTGNETTEWVYLYATWLGELFPQYTINYYLWDTTSYAAAVEIQAGAGAYTLSVYNCSLAGARPGMFMGTLFQAAFVDIPSVDLVIVNMGHNLTTAIGPATIETLGANIFVESVGSILTRHTGAGAILCTQNPRRDDDTHYKTYSAIKNAAGLLCADVADCYLAFLAAGKDVALYADNLHPSTAGTQLFLNSVKRCHAGITPRPAANVFMYKPNLLPNGDFADFTAPTVPDGWTGSNVTFAEETTLYESPNGYSLSLAKTASGSNALMYQDLSPPLLRQTRGGWLTFAVRMYIPNGQPSTNGRIGLVSNLNSANAYQATVDQRDGWHWRTISLYVGPTTSYVRAQIYCDLSTGSNGQIYVDRAILCKGRLPADAF